jgi:cell wall-associated NlpC family hydrolase
MKRYFVTFCMLLGLWIALQTVIPQNFAQASVVPKRLIAYEWAYTQRGKPYIYGGTGPYGYDCSGLVMEAYEHAGVYLPRTTYEMLADSRQLVFTNHPVKGDLAFYGSGHVELYDVPGFTFGAHATGQAIGAIEYGWGWVPTAYMRLRWWPQN